jgi:hypothetical protein
MQGRFTKLIGPLTCETTGALDAWEFPDDTELIVIWNLVFEEDYPIEGGDFKSHRFIIAKTLVCFHYADFSLLIVLHLDEAYHLELASQICRSC